jgi:hypothetical protein
MGLGTLRDVQLPDRLGGHFFAARAARFSCDVSVDIIDIGRKR